MHRLEVISPIRVFLLVLFVVFAIEAMIMLVLAAFERTPDGAWFLSIIDALVLVLALCPVLWLLVVRPLRATIAVRGALLARALQIQEEERARLARDLHDELGQTQTALLLGARSIHAARSLDEARDRSEEVARMAGEALESSRRIARGLAPGVLRDLGLAAAVDRHCEDVESASGLAIERSIDIGSRRFAPSIEIAVYRVIQESLTNVVKHAKASRARVSLECDARELRIRVEDDGRGVSAHDVAEAAADVGLGIAGMRERMLLLNGSFSVRSRPGAGTIVSATVPLGPQDQAVTLA